MMATARHYLHQDNALATGLDWDLETPHPDYRINGQVVGTYTRENDWGYGARLNLTKSAGTYLKSHLILNYDRPELDLGPTGFFNNAGRKGFNTGATYTVRPNRFGVRRISYTAELNQKWNFADIPLIRRFDLRAHHELDRGYVLLGYNADLPVYDDNSSDHGNLLGQHGTQEFWTWTGRRLGSSGNLTLKLGYRPSLGQAHHWVRPGIGLNFCPLHRWEVHLTADYSRYTVPRAHVTSTEDVHGNDADIVGRLDQETLDLVTRSTFLFTNTLSLQFYNQLYFGVTGYDNFQRLVSPFTYGAMQDIDYTDDPGFRTTTCNSNLTLRWEFRPGSTLYLVWSQAGSREADPGTSGLLSGFKNITGQNLEHSFLMKFDYRFLINIR
jgi:hypothetical protein